MNLFQFFWESFSNLCYWIFFFKNHRSAGQPVEHNFPEANECMSGTRCWAGHHDGAWVPASHHGALRAKEKLPLLVVRVPFASLRTRTRIVLVQEPVILRSIMPRHEKHKKSREQLTNRYPWEGTPSRSAPRGAPSRCHVSHAGRTPQEHIFFYACW